MTYAKGADLVGLFAFVFERCVFIQKRYLHFMKKKYVRPVALVIAVAVEQSLLMDSAHSNRHQGFVEEPDPSLNIEDDDNDSSPF